MNKISLSEDGFGSKTLELFYKTFDNLHFTESDIAALLEKIEKKHSMSTHEAAMITNRIRIKLTEEDKKFFEELRLKKQVQKFCDETGIHPNFLREIKRKRECTQKTYERLKNCIKQWKEKHAS